MTQHELTALLLRLSRTLACAAPATDSSATSANTIFGRSPEDIERLLELGMTMATSRQSEDPRKLSSRRRQTVTIDGDISWTGFDHPASASLWPAGESKVIDAWLRIRSSPFTRSFTQAGAPLSVEMDQTAAETEINPCELTLTIE